MEKKSGFLTGKAVISLAVLICAASVALFDGKRGLSSSPGDAGESNGLTLVDVLTLGSDQPKLAPQRFSGVLLAAREATLSSKTIGRIEAVHFDVGDKVVEGEEIATLEQDELIAAVKLAEAELAGQSAILAELRNGARSEELDRARARVKELEAAFAHQTITYKRFRAGNRSNAIAAAELDQATYAYQTAKSQLEIGQLQLEELEKGVRSEKINAQQATLDAAEAKLLQCKAMLEAASIRAPFSGVVQSRRVHEGAIVSPGQQIIHLVEVAELEVRVGLPPEVALDLVNHRDLNIDAIVAGRKFALELVRVAPALDKSTGTRLAIFKPHGNLAENLASGDSADVWIPTLLDTSGWWIPTNSLTSASHGLWSVLTAEKTELGQVFKVNSQPVELLRTAGELSQVRGQLEEGKRVIVSGIHRIVPGQHVRVQPAFTAISN